MIWWLTITVLHINYHELHNKFDSITVSPHNCQLNCRFGSFALIVTLFDRSVRHFVSDCVWNPINKTKDTKIVCIHQKDSKQKTHKNNGPKNRHSISSRSLPQNMYRLNGKNSLNNKTNTSLHLLNITLIWNTINWKFLTIEIKFSNGPEIHWFLVE